MSDLVSKISASGLSAGVFLLWWPAHVTSQGGDVLLARGVLWAAAFELLLIGFRPLERAIGRAVREREPAALAPTRIGPGAPRRGGGAGGARPDADRPRPRGRRRGRRRPGRPALRHPRRGHPRPRRRA